MLRDALEGGGTQCLRTEVGDFGRACEQVRCVEWTHLGVWNRVAEHSTVWKTRGEKTSLDQPLWVRRTLLISWFLRGLSRLMALHH